VLRSGNLSRKAVEELLETRQQTVFLQLLPGDMQDLLDKSDQGNAKWLPKSTASSLLTIDLGRRRQFWDPLNTSLTSLHGLSPHHVAQLPLLAVEATTLAYVDALLETGVTFVDEKTWQALQMLQSKLRSSLEKQGREVDESSCWRLLRRIINARRCSPLPSSSAAEPRTLLAWARRTSYPGLLSWKAASPTDPAMREAISEADLLHLLG